MSTLDLTHPYFKSCVLKKQKDQKQYHNLHYMARQVDKGDLVFTRTLTLDQRGDLELFKQKLVLFPVK